MLSKADPVTREHFQYITDRTTQEDPFLQDLKQAAREADIPAIWISPAQASFMQILLRASGAKEIIEVGTLAGYSAITMARALPQGGRIRTIELHPEFADFAERWASQSDVSEKIEVHRGSGEDVLATFESHSADVAFLDADKRNYPLYLRESLRIIRPGGLILVDNAFAFGELLEEHPSDPEVQSVRDFNELMEKQEGLQSVIVPLGDGVWVGVKTDA